MSPRRWPTCLLLANFFVMPAYVPQHLIFGCKQVAVYVPLVDVQVDGCKPLFDEQQQDFGVNH